MTHKVHGFKWMWVLAGIVALQGLDQAAATQGFSDQVVTLKDGLKEMLQTRGATKLNKLTLTPTPEQKTAIQSKCGMEAPGPYTLYQGLKADGSLVGTVVIMDEKGKEGPLQMLVALQPDGTVYDAAFTVFGEERGKPALSWNFLKQFMGKSSKDPLVPGKDIDGVSGATYTSKAVAVAMKRSVCVYAEVAPHGP